MSLPDDIAARQRGWRRIWCTCSTCEAARTFESLDEECRTNDHRGLSLRRYHRAMRMPIDVLVHAAQSMRLDEDWWLTPPHNEFTDLKSAEIAGEIQEAR